MDNNIARPTKRARFSSFVEHFDRQNTPIITKLMTQNRQNQLLAELIQNYAPVNEVAKKKLIDNFNSKYCKDKAKILMGVLSKIVEDSGKIPPQVTTDEFMEIIYETEDMPSNLADKVDAFYEPKIKGKKK